MAIIQVLVFVFCIFSPSYISFAMLNYRLLKRHISTSKNNYISWFVYLIQSKSVYWHLYFSWIATCSTSSIGTSQVEKRNWNMFGGPSKRDFILDILSKVLIICGKILWSTLQVMLFSLRWLWNFESLCNPLKSLFTLFFSIWMKRHFTCTLRYFKSRQLKAHILHQQTNSQ